MALALRETHPAQGVSERHLVRAVRRGDDHAFELLFERYRRRITSYVYGLVRDADRAEDITQEIFIAALRRLRATERPIAFKPWIYEIAKNACIDEFRRTSRAAVVSLEEEQEAATSAIRLVDEVSPEVAWERRERFENLVAAFNGLSDAQHRMLVMRELEGLSYGEIGGRLGMSRTAVESTLFRARRRLSAEYEELRSGRQCAQVQAAIDDLSIAGARAPGIRERRRISAHLSHCHACVRHARASGVEASHLRAPSIAERIAAILPFGGLGGLLRRLAARHGSTAARSGTLADAPPVLAVSRAAAAIAAIAVAGTVLPSVEHHARSATVPGNLAPVPAQFAVPVGVAAAHGSEPVRALPAAVLANVGDFRAALLRGTHTGRGTASQGHAIKGRHAASPPPAPGGQPGSGARTDGSAGSPDATGTSGGASAVGTRGRSTVTGARATVGSAGSDVGQLGSRVVSGTSGAVTRTPGAAGTLLANTGAAAGGAASQLGGAARAAVSGATSGVASPVTQAGQAAGEAVSQTGAAAGTAAVQTGAAVGAAVAKTGEVAGAATSALTPTSAPAGGLP